MGEMISIVIPTKNNGDVLEQCLGSIGSRIVLVIWTRVFSGDLDWATRTESAMYVQRVLTELKYPLEVLKEMMGGELLKQSPFYKETLEEGLLKGEEKGIALCREEGILPILATRFGSVSDQSSRRMHTIRERNAALRGDLIKLAATVKDIGEFERQLDEMR